MMQSCVLNNLNTKGTLNTTKHHNTEHYNVSATHSTYWFQTREDVIRLLVLHDKAQRSTYHSNQHDKPMLICHTKPDILVVLTF